MYKILGADQKEYGPVTADQVRQWIREGRANSQTLIQGPNSTEWKPLNSFPEFSDLLAPVAPSVPAGAPPYGETQLRTDIPNYLWQAIVCTVCCCPHLLGIPAIVYAAQVNTKVALGDVAGAMQASRNAKLWCWIAFGIGLVLNSVYLLFLLGRFAQGFSDAFQL